MTAEPLRSDAHSKRCWCMDADPRDLHERIHRLETELAEWHRYQKFFPRRRSR